MGSGLRLGVVSEFRIDTIRSRKSCRSLSYGITPSTYLPSCAFIFPLAPVVVVVDEWSGQLILSWRKLALSNYLIEEVTSSEVENRKKKKRRGLCRKHNTRDRVLEEERH